MGYRLLIINPGSTSTKLAVYSRMPKSRTNEARIPYFEEKMAERNFITTHIPRRFQISQASKAEIDYKIVDGFIPDDETRNVL